MTDIKIKRYADKENLKKLVKYSKDTFAKVEHTHTKAEITDFPALAIVATTGSYNDLLDKPTLDNYYTKSEVVNLLSNYYTKTQINIMLNNAGSDTEGGDDTQGGLSFYTDVERAPGYDGTSQINIVEDSNTVEDE